MTLALSVDDAVGIDGEDSMGVLAEIPLLGLTGKAAAAVSSDLRRIRAPSQTPARISAALSVAG